MTARYYFLMSIKTLKIGPSPAYQMFAVDTVFIAYFLFYEILSDFATRI